MSDTDFEARLARGIDAYAQGGVRPIDRRAIAAATIAAGSQRRPRFRPGAFRLASFRPVPRLIVVLLALVALALALWVLGQPRGIPAGRLAYIQNGDVYVASADGSNAVKLLDDPAVSFTKVTWLDGGDRLAIEGQGVVTVVDLTTGHRRRVGTSGEEGTWRPGGHQFAYVRTRDGQPQVTVIVDVDTGASRELPGGGQPGGERSWSPDGRWFASALDGSIMLIDTVTGEKRVIIAPAPGDPPSTYDMAWAPDGSRFAYVTQTTGSCEVGGGCVGGQSRILVLPVDGGSPTHVAGPITDTTADGGYQNLGPRLLPIWSPDGEWIAYRGGPGLSIVHPDGTGQRDLVTSPIGWFGWAADSSGLEYVATTGLDDASGELWWVGLADGKPRSLGLEGVGQIAVRGTFAGESAKPLGIGASSPLPSGTPAAPIANAVVTPPPAPPADPSGAWHGLVFSDGSDGCNAVRRLDFGALGELRALTDCSRRVIVSPDGVHAAIGGAALSDGELASIDLRDGSRTEIRTGAEYLNWDFWSPGGRWLTWSGAGKDVIVRADGTGATVLPTLIGDDRSKSWSPDDSHLAVTTADGLLVGDGSGANLVNIGTFPGVSSWSWDGGRFAYVLDGDAWVTSSDGTSAHNLTGFEFGGAQSTALSPDGETLAVVQAGTVLWLIGLDGTRRQVDLGPGVPLDYARLRWAKDGSRLAVETRHSYGEAAGTTYLVPVDGSPITRLDDAWDPTWSPDGRYLALLATHEGASAVDVTNADGSGRVPVTTAPVMPGGDDLAWVP